MLNETNWPKEYLPGTTDNFASNEVIVKDLTAADVFLTTSTASYIFVHSGSSLSDDYRRREDCWRKV
jgi:hypothetical protein